jgi:oligoendopeptidase F
LTAELAPAAFGEWLKALEAIETLSNCIYSFAGLAFAAQTQDQAIQAFRVQVEQRLTELQNRTLFFSLWWKGLDDAPAEKLLAAAGEFRYWLEVMRAFKPHTLSEPEEKVVNIKDLTGARAIVSLYDTITNRYTFKLTVDGETRELTRGELMVYARHHDANLRAAAYQEIYRVYGNDGPILGQMYQALVNNWRNENLGLRHFKAPISVRNLSNDIPDEAVDTLLTVAERNAPLFQRFFRLKARWLKMERLRRYDVYAPVLASDKRYTFAQGAEMVLDTFEQFEPRVAALARRVFDEKHLDSEVRRGKRGGAFCWSVLPKMAPWVLLNYQGRADDVSTMAHELGHAVHSMLAAEHNVFTFQSSLPLAETASTFAEMLLVDRLLLQETDAAVRHDMLFQQVDDAYGTILRQSYFALFERQAHELVKQGASADELATAYLANLHSQFGDAVDVGDEFRWEWVSIPHIYHTPFYVYAYAFGQLLVLSLYKQFKAEGAAFKPRYIKILSAGGSQAPEKTLADAGIDIRSADFWQGGFDVVKGLVEQLEVVPVP